MIIQNIMDKIEGFNQQVEIKNDNIVIKDCKCTKCKNFIQTTCKF